MAGPVPPGMEAVLVDKPFVATSLEVIAKHGCSKVFVMANKSSAPLAQPLLDALSEKSMLAGPLCTELGMGGAEEGLLKACDAAASVKADCLVTIGGGAVQDAGKIVRMWLSTDGAGEEKSSLAKLNEAQNRDPMPDLPPQVACPNSFAMAELSARGGVTTTAGTKTGIAHPKVMPTVVVFDPALTAGLPDWVRFGTAVRGIEHAVSAATSPKATDAIRAQALEGLALSVRGINAMLADPEHAAGSADTYVGGQMSICALMEGCYPSLAHLLENQYSAKFNVHQGSCSGILCARLLAHHAKVTAEQQAKIAQIMGGAEGVSAARCVADLVARLPGVASEHAETKLVSPEALEEFAKGCPIERLSGLSPAPIANDEELLAIMTRALDTL